MTAQNKFKRLRIQTQILEDANLLLRKEFNFPQLQLVTFTRITLTPDYLRAVLYWDSVQLEMSQDREQTHKIIDTTLESTRKKMRSLVARHLNLRLSPELTFAFDATYVSQNHIEQLLKDSPEEIG